MWGLVLTLTFGRVTRGIGMVLYPTGLIISGIEWDVRIHCSVLRKKLAMLNFSAFELGNQ